MKPLKMINVIIFIINKFRFLGINHVAIMLLDNLVVRLLRKAVWHDDERNATLIANLA